MFYESGRGRRPTADGYQALTPRELEVLRLIAQGLANAEIAALLCVSRNTLQHHVTAVLAKLGGLTRSQAIVYAFRAGLAESPERSAPPKRE